MSVAPLHRTASSPHRGSIEVATLVALYAVYELAPRAFDLPAHSDQQIAGLTMKIIGDLPLWFAFGVIFFRWARESGGSNPVHPSVGQQSATGSAA